MSDPRLTPDPSRRKQAVRRRVSVPVLDLCRRIEGPRDRQLLFGAGVTVFDVEDGWAYVQAEQDGYCGFVTASGLAEDREVTHRVIAPSTHIYAAADFKSPDRMALSHGSRLSVEGEEGRFARTPDGYVPRVHIAPASDEASDPVEVAQLYLGTPYLWGGNSRWGIDCSGLVQAALLACGIDCPGDSDMQAALGHPATDGYRRNDLLFWKGHVALVSDADTLIHANAHVMATVFEPIEDAIRRIEAQGDGAVTAHRRIADLTE